MGRLANSCANLFNSYQSSLTLTQIDEEITKEQDKPLRDISDLIKDLEKELFYGPRAKKVSQLIAKSWLPGGEEYKQIFLEKKSDEIKKLFRDNEIFDDEDDAKCFETIKVETKFDSPPYVGSLQLKKTKERDPIQFTLIIPYPDPKPPQLTDEVLEQWVNNDDQELDPPDYIPYSTT